MFECITKLFGEGKIRFEGEMEDGSTFTGKTPFIGDIESEEEIVLEIANELLVEKGYFAKRMRIVGMKGYITNSNFKLTGKWFTLRHKR